MLSAVSALLYVLVTTVRITLYLPYLVPFPILLVGERNNFGAACRTALVTSLLLALLLGPFRGATYFLEHGVTGLAIALGWHWGLPWLAAIPLATFVRSGGQLLYVLLMSGALNENLLNVVMANVARLVDQVMSMTGMAGRPSDTFLVCLALSSLFVTGLIYVLLLHLIYSVLLIVMGHDVKKLPGFLRRGLIAQQ